MAQATAPLFNSTTSISAMPRLRPKSCGDAICREVPCVDGSELASAFFTFAALVGAAMCSAFKCGTRGRWP